MRKTSAYAKWLLILILIFGAYFRASGLFRGLDRNAIFHPDSPKQVMMLQNYLNGSYVQYYDSLFYDGYPYGLNRLDEILIRGAWGLASPVMRLLNAGHDYVGMPNQHELFYAGRVLRLLYGLLIVWLLYGAVMRFGGSVPAALSAAGLYALAPIGVTVSHSVTGDIGVDLFLAVGLYSVSAYTEAGKLRWLGVLSLACGMGFACKFQGVLGLWVGAIVILGGVRLVSSGKLRFLIKRCSVMAVCFLAGVLVMNPALMLQPENTWRNMRNNFAFIRDYGVSADFLERPLHVRLCSSLSDNVPVIAGSIGYLMLILAGVSLFLSISKLISGKAARQRDEVEIRRSWVFAAVASFPWMALLLSILLKPAVQPFHFSFLLPAMAVSAGILVSDVLNTGWRRGKPVILLLLALCFGELSVDSIREDFFWRRPDIFRQGYLFSESVFGYPNNGASSHCGRRAVKSFYAEPAKMSVFRNRPSGLEHPQFDWWRQNKQLPVPSVPFPVDLHWIFINGSVFPRNDRMFSVPASGRGLSKRAGYGGSALLLPTWSRSGCWTEKTLVFNEAPESVQIGLRSGRWPARCTVDVSGSAPEKVFLPPHSQVILSMESLDTILIRGDGSEKRPDRHLIPVRLRAQLGPVWATVIEGPDVLEGYRRFGPEGDAFGLEEQLPDGLAEKLQALCYLGDGQPHEIHDKLECLPGSEQPLAAGPYVLEASVLNAGLKSAGVRFALRDASGGSSGVEDFEAILAPGAVQEIVWRFEKGFAPYDADLMTSADGPEVSVLSWTLRPDALKLRDWCARSAGSSENNFRVSLEKTPLNVEFPGIGVFRSLVMPDNIEAGRPFSYTAEFEVDRDISHKTFHEAVCFIHVINANNELVAALDFPLREASWPGSLINWRQAEPLPAGQYEVVGGVYNVRARERFSLNLADEDERKRRRRSFLVMPKLVVQ